MASNLRILLAEDNEVNQHLMMRILARTGYEATLARNGIQVLNKMDKQDYDLILMDIQMPEMDGVTATRLIRAHYAEDKQPKIYALTAENSIEGREKYLAAGMNGVLTKPIQIDELVTILNNISGEHQNPMAEVARFQEHQSQVEEESSSPKKASSLNEFLTFDLKVINDFMELMGEEGQDSVRHLIDLYKKSAPELIEKIEESSKQKNLEDLLRLVHTLKGSSCQIGARRMEQLCTRLEVLLKQSGVDPFLTFIPGIKQEYDNLTLELDLYLASLD